MDSMHSSHSGTQVDGTATTFLTMIYHHAKEKSKIWSLTVKTKKSNPEVTHSIFLITHSAELVIWFSS